MATKEGFRARLSNIVECCLKASGNTSVDIVVSEFNAHRCPELKREYILLLSQLFPIGPRWCYIHRDGVEECKRGTLLHFQEYEGRLPAEVYQTSKLYELCMKKDATEADESEESVYTVDMLAAKSPQGDKDWAHKAIDRAHGESCFDSKKYRKDAVVKIITDHETHMKKMLKEGLEWFCKEKRGNKKYLVKLEGRFGKILWRNLPEDVLDCSWGVEKFADLCYTDTRHSRTFTTDVKLESAAEVKQQLNEERISVLETFDVKFTNPRGGRERREIDIRIKFEEGRPKALITRKNDAKIVIFDVLCLHRIHDVRMTLNYCEVINQDSQENEIVQRLLSTVSLSDPDKGTITLSARTEDWNVNFIRHKKRESYSVDDKYSVTVTAIRECQLENKPFNMCVDVTPELYKAQHVEMEFHNRAWISAFDRGVESFRSDNMEYPPTLPEIAGAIPHPWQPDDILVDFQEFWENLDSLNEMLGPSP